MLLFRGSNMAQCKFCQKVIVWTKEGYKNIAVESDGSVHQCQEFKNSIKSTKSMDRTSLTPEEIKKYEDAINKKK